MLTGGAYLHLSHRVADLADQAEHALALFASTSPSYLILQSLDGVNPYLAGDYPAALATCCDRVAALKAALVAAGYTLAGEEPTKVTVATKPYGYTGEQMAAYLAQRGIHVEFADPDYLVLMISPENTPEDLQTVQTALTALPKAEPLTSTPPTLTPPQAAIGLRRALFAPAETLPLERCIGRVLASPTVGCPPAVPVLVGGEVVDESAAAVFRYYGYDTIRVVKK